MVLIWPATHMGVFFSRNGWLDLQDFGYRCRCLTNKHVGLQVVPKNAGTFGEFRDSIWLLKNFKSEMSESTTFPGGSQLGGLERCFLQPEDRKSHGSGARLGGCGSADACGVWGGACFNGRFSATDGITWDYMGIYGNIWDYMGLSENVG